MTKNRYEAARAALEPSVLLEQLRDMGDIGLTRPGDRDSGRTRKMCIRDRPDTEPESTCRPAMPRS